MRAATRVAGQGLSPIRRMSLGAPESAVDLGLGEPGWPVPDVVGRGGTRAPSLSYGPNTSDPALVRAVARYASTPTCDVAPDGVMVTAGSQAALFALFQSWVEPGSTVLVPDPGFVAYPTLARMCGATPVGYPLGADGGLDADALVTTLAEQPHTSLVVLNHPANPTGGLASAPALSRVAEACVDQGVLLVSDEVYAELWVDRRPASLRDVSPAGVVLGSMSKAFAAPGLRIGWALGAPDVLAPARLVHNAMTTAPSRLSQAAALTMLDAADEVLPASRAEVRARWDAVDRIAPRLRTSGHRFLGDGHQEPMSRTAERAGFYLWLPLPDHLADSTEHDGTPSTEAFALRLRDEGGVTTIPGTAFGERGEGFLRVSLGGPVDDLEEGLRRLAPWWEA